MQNSKNTFIVVKEISKKIMEEKEKKTLTPKEKRAEFWKTVKFLLFSLSAGAIEFCSFWFMTSCIPHPVFMDAQYKWVPLTISLALSVIWNFTFNRKFTFQSANNVPIAMLKVLAYYLVFGPLSIGFVQLYLIDYLKLEKWELLLKIAVMFVNLVTEFLYQRWFVFGKSIDTNDIAKKRLAKEEQEKTPED